MTNYQEMEQTHWACYQFPDKAYYYGEVGYLEESGVVQPKDNAEAASNPKNKLVRHGFGVYIYNVQNEGQASRYEGYWDKDRKHGEGKLTVPNQFIYEGNFKDGSYHQSGKMTWSNGDSYDGNWKKSRMQGGGSFKHHAGFVLKGSFKANFFIDENVLRNPQMGEKEYDLFKKQRKDVLKQKERNQKIKHGFVEKVSAGDSDRLLEICTRSNKNNRIPLIVASEESKFDLAALEGKLGVDRKCNSFDLRKAYLLKGEEKYNYKLAFAEMTRSTLVQGGALVINLDESESGYKQAFYPDIREFYDGAGFSSSTWSRETMRRREVYEKVTGGAQISGNYILAVWSKLKLSEELSEERVRQKLQLRFESILPFIKIDVVFLVGGK